MDYFVYASLDGILLFGYYKMLELNYETNYFSLSDFEGEKRMSLLGYLVFRFIPPLFALTAFTALFNNLEGVKWLLLWILVLGVMSRHLLAFMNQCRAGFRAVALLHVLVMFLVLPQIYVTESITNYLGLEKYAPNQQAVIDNLWSGLFGAILIAIYFSIVNTKRISRESLLIKSLASVDASLLRYAYNQCTQHDADPALVISVIAIENLNRPKWARTLERLIPGSKTTGLMQVSSNKMLSDKESVAKAIKTYFSGTALLVGLDDYEGVLIEQQKIIRKYNEGDSYYKQIEAYKYTIMEKFKEITGIYREGVGANSVDYTQVTYNKSAARLSRYYDIEGAHIRLVEISLDYLPESDRNTCIDLGCGAGRDYRILCNYFKTYKGYDYSVGMLKLARNRFPKGDFKKNDIRKMYFQDNVDAFYAFESIIHLDKENLIALLFRISKSLTDSGIFCCSFLPKSDDFVHSRDKVDEFGARKFFYYDTEELADIAKTTQLEIKYVDTYWVSEVHRIFMIIGRSK